MTNEEIILSLETVLNKSRLAHSLSVAKTAQELAHIYGADEDKAFLAGIVHDCAKCYTDDELYKRISDYEIIADDISLKNPKLLHAYVGAYEAEKIYGIKDKQILDAVYYHTIGKAGMSKICEIIYLSDAIEPLRSYDGVDELRKTSHISLEKAIFDYTEMSINFLIKRGEYIHPNALETRNYYLELIR